MMLLSSVSISSGARNHRVLPLPLLKSFRKKMFKRGKENLIWYSFEVANHSSFSFLVNEIIGRDMSQITVSQGPEVISDAPLPGPESPDVMSSNSAQWSFVPTTTCSACFSPGTYVSNQTSESVTEVGFTVGKAAFLHLKPWADFVKNRNSISYLSCGKWALLFIYIYIFK